MSEKAAPVVDLPAGADQSGTAEAPPVTSAATPSTTAAAPATTATTSVANTLVTTTTAVPTATVAETAAVPVKGAKSKNWKLKRACRAKAAAMDSVSQQETPGTDHPKDPSVWASTTERSTDEPKEMASRGVEPTAVPPLPPPPVQEPAATAGETSAAVEESVQVVADLLVAEGLDGPPSNISMPGRSAPTSSGGGTPQYFDLSGQKVMPTRCEDRA